MLALTKYQTIKQLLSTEGKEANISEVQKDRCVPLEDLPRGSRDAAYQVAWPII